MEEVKKEQFKNILEKISENKILINKLVNYLENNNLMEDLYSKMYYTIEKTELIYKINYYKNKLNGKLLSISDVKNSYNLSKNDLEDYIVYVYDEIKTLLFKGQEVAKEITRCQEYSKSYNNLSIKLVPLSINNDREINWFKIINENPLLFIYIVLEYNINIDELKNIDEKSYTYKKEIKKN